MNIRGTDSTALAAVTDLFVAPAPSRDGKAGSFEQALQPPRPYEPSSPSAPRQDSTAPQRKAPEARSEDASSRESDTGDTPEVTSATNESEVAEQTAPVVEKAAENIAAETSVVEEATDDENVAAESIAVAAVAVAEQKLPEPQRSAVTTEAVTAESSADEAPLPAAGVGVAVEEPTALTFVAGQQLGTATVSEPMVAEVAVEAIPELPTDVVASDASQPTAGIGVLPSAVVPQAASSATRNTASQMTAKSAPLADDRTQHVKSTAQTTPGESGQEGAQEVAADAISAVQMKTTEDDSQDGSKKDQPFSAVDNAPVMTSSQPVDLPAPFEAKSELPAATATEAPVVSELHSTHHATHDPAKLTTTQPLSNPTLTNRLPAQALISGTPQQPAPPPLHVDAARFLQRVTKAFESARERGGEIRLRLSPPELGALRVEVNMSEQGLAARVEVETNDARTVLLENLPALRERLAEQGLRLERFDVELSQREPDQRGGNLPDQPRDRQSQPEARTVRTPVLRPSASAATSSESSPNSDWPDRQLNVIV